MLRNEVVELYYITSYANVPSICQHGLLSHDLAASMPHESIALEGVQDLREPQIVAGRRLHSYVNLYFWGRNSMLNRRYIWDGWRSLCVLSVDHRVLELPGVAVTDRNAAKSWRRTQLVSDKGLEIVDRATTFAERWDHPDPLEKERRKTAGQAEVLVPDRVEPRYVRGAYLPSRKACAELHAIAPNLPMLPWPYLFFLGGSGARGERYKPDA
jgi:ssDNA thymidine ADP-ribosyltransferase DarT-like protein